MLKKISRIFSRRDLDRFPEDENGDILFRIWKRGCELDTPRTIDFSLVFPSQEQALAFASELQLPGEVEVKFYEEEQCWDLRFSPIMVPSWTNISENEARLGEAAAKHEGKNDGWGFFSS